MILEPSKPADALYVIVDGSVELSRNGQVLTVARQNEVLGAWALFDESDPMPVSAKTTEDTRLLRIGRDDFYDLLSDNSEITSAIFSTLSPPPSAMSRGRCLRCAVLRRSVRPGLRANCRRRTARCRRSRRGS